jgi:uncharacterized membrane protein
MLKENDKNQKTTVHIQLRFISLMVSLKYIFTNNSKMMLKKYTGFHRNKWWRMPKKNDRNQK